MAEVVARTQAPTPFPPGTEISPGKILKNAAGGTLLWLCCPEMSSEKEIFPKEVEQGQGIAVIPEKSSPKIPFFRSATPEKFLNLIIK